MNISWTWLLIGLIAGVLGSAMIKGAIGSVKGKVAG